MNLKIILCLLLAVSAVEACKLKVNFLGLRDVRVSLYSGDFTDPNPTVQENKRNVAKFRLQDGETYAVKVQHGGQELDYTGVQCNDGDKDVVLHEMVCTLTTKFNGVRGVSVNIEGPGSVNQGATGRNGRYNRHLLRASGYVLSVSGENTITHTRTVDCTEATKVEEDFVAKMSVVFRGVSGATVDLYRTAAPNTLVKSISGRNGRYNVWVLRDSYRVVVTRNGYSVEGTGDCSTSNACSVEGLVSLMRVKFPGMSGVTITATEKTTGQVFRTITGRRGSYAFYVLRGTYDVRASANGIDIDTTNLDCTQESCQINALSHKAKVIFRGVRNVSVKGYLPGTNTEVFARDGRNGGVTFWVFPGHYDIKLSRNGVNLQSLNVDCTSQCTINGFHSKAVIKFKGVRGADVSCVNRDTLDPQGSKQNRNGGWTLWVLRQHLRCTVTKAGNSQTFDMDCTGDSCLQNDLVSLMVAKFTGVSRVRVDAYSSSALMSAAGNGDVKHLKKRNGWTSFWVLKGSYYLRLEAPGGVVKAFSDPIDCTGATCTHADTVTTKLSVFFPGIRKVAMEYRTLDNEDGSNGAVVRQQKKRNGATAIWVFKGNYEVDITEKDTTITRQVDCTGASCTISQLTTTVRASFPGCRGVKIDVYKNGGTEKYRAYKKRNGGYNFHLLRGTYDIKITDGPVTKSFDAVDCETSNEVSLSGISALASVFFPGFTGVNVKATLPGDASSVVYSKNNRNNWHSFWCFCGTYDVILSGGTSQTFSNQVVACDQVVEVGAPDPPAAFSPGGGSTCDVTFDLTGGKAISGQLKLDSDDSLAQSRTPTDGDWVIENLPAGDYTATLFQGASSTSTAVSCSGTDITISNLLADLTINYNGLDDIETSITTSDDKEVKSGTSDDSKTYKVLRSTYDVDASNGVIDDTVTGVDCSSGTCSVPDSALVCTLTIDHTGLVPTEINLFDDPANDADTTNNDDAAAAVRESITIGTDTTVIQVLQGFYQVEVQHYAAGMNKSVDCTGTTGSVNGYVADFTANFNGFTATINITVDGEGEDEGNVISAEDQTNSWTAKVLRLADYTVFVDAGSLNQTFSTDCSSGTCSVTVGSAFTATFTGLSDVDCIAEKDGVTVGQALDQDDSCSLSLFRDVYLIKVIANHGDSSTTYTKTGVDCTSGTCSISDIVCSLTVSHAPLMADLSLKSQNGDEVCDQDNQADTSTCTVLKGVYDMVLGFAGSEKTTSNVDMTGASAAITDTVCVIVVEFDGRTNVDVDVVEDASNNIVASADNAANSASFSVLAGLDYTITLGGAGYAIEEQRTVANCQSTVTLPVPKSVEMLALEALYDACGGANWANKDGWVFDATLPVCKTADTSDYHGVTCRTFVVKELHLEYNNMICPNGLPGELFDLWFLQKLDLKGNNLKNLPTTATIDELENLKVLDLSYGEMRGQSLPNEIGNMRESLQVLRMIGNGLTGPIPSSYNNLGFLKELKLSHNMLTGPLPDLSGLEEIKILELDNNKITGSLPDPAAWQLLSKLWLQSNMFSGSIPAGFSTLPHIVSVDISDNDLSGRFPDMSLLTTLTAMKSEGNPEMEETVQCSDNNGASECTAVDKEQDDPNSAAAAGPLTALVMLLTLLALFM